MFQQNLPAQSNASDFVTTVTVTDKTTGDAFDLTGYTVKIDITKKGAPRTALISATSPASTIDLTSADDGEIGISIPASSMANLCAGAYELGVTIVSSGGAQTNVTVVDLPIVEGHPR
jgi:hypothetical protein